jgi:hypothetical protein
MADEVEKLLREILVEQARHGSELEGIRGQLAEVKDNAKEARDGARDVAGKLAEQNLPARMTEALAEMRRLNSDLRADLVHAHDRLKADMTKGDADLAIDVKALSVRVEVLEKGRAKDDGAKGALAWLVSKAPWIAGLFAALAGGTILKDVIK